VLPWSTCPAVAMIMGSLRARAHMLRRVGKVVCRSRRGVHRPRATLPTPSTTRSDRVGNIEAEVGRHVHAPLPTPPYIAIPLARNPLYHGGHDARGCSTYRNER